MGAVLELISLMRWVFLVLFHYIVSDLFEIEFPTVFVPPSQLVISVHDCNFSSPQFLLHLLYCCCGLVSILWGESVPDYPFVVICFLFPVMVDSSFALRNQLLLEFLPAWFFHSRFLFQASSQNLAILPFLTSQKLWVWIETLLRQARFQMEEPSMVPLKRIFS
jgi:hypothetical protein